MPAHLCLAHLSDTHFGTVVPEVRAALLAELRADPPDLIVVTGDITQRARQAQFQEAREFLDDLPQVPRLCLPGNHDLPLFDLPRRFLNPYGRYRRYISPMLDPVFADERIAVLGVDATRRYRHVDGTLGARQVEVVASRLAALSQPFRVVATHQPLAAAVASDFHNVARGAAHALDRWIVAGADLFLGGHIHLPYCLEVRSADRRDSSVLLQAGTSLSRRIREGIPNSWNRVTFTQDKAGRRIGIERRDYDAASGRFKPARSHEATSMMNRRRTGLNGWKLSR